MTIVTRTTAKSYFETGDKPTQAQFIDFIDSTRFDEDYSNFGKAFVSATTTASAQNRLGIGTLGRNLFEANTTASGLNQLGMNIPGNVGNILFASNTTASAQNNIGGGAVGRNLFEVATTASATNQLGIGTNTYNPNLIINPSFLFDQRNVGASTSVADDVYCFDRWYTLTQTAAITVIQQTLQENGQATNIRLTQSQASAQRMGIAQIVEAKTSQPLRDGAYALSARIRCSSSQAIRYAVLEWTGTADSVTSDVVSDWTSGTYTAGNFFLGSNLTVTQVGSITPSANTWTDITSLTGTLGSSGNNLIVFFWTEGTAAQNVTLDVGKVKLENNSVATPFIARPPQVELQDCERRLEKSYNAAVAPGTVVSDATQAERLWLGSAAINGFSIRFRVKKATAPTVVVYDASGTAGKINNASGGNVAGSAITISENGFVGQCDGTDDNQLLFWWKAECEL